MCEPYHSILSYPDDNDLTSGGGTAAARVEAVATRGKIGTIFKRIRDWLFLSVIGRSHSGARADVDCSNTLLCYLPPDTSYEGLWWERKVRLDGALYVPDNNLKEVGYAQWALEAALEYSRRVAISDLGRLRLFLKQSIRNSDTPHLYVEAVHDKLLVSNVSKNKLMQTLKTRGGVRGLNWRHGWLREAVRNNLNLTIKLIMDATQSRSDLHPSWSDDKVLWAPG